MDKIFQAYNDFRRQSKLSDEHSSVAFLFIFHLLPLMVKNKSLNGYDQFMIAEIQRSLTLYKPVDPEKALAAYQSFSAKHDATRRGGQSVGNGFSLN